MIISIELYRLFVWKKTWRLSLNILSVYWTGTLVCSENAWYSFSSSLDFDHKLKCESWSSSFGFWTYLRVAETEIWPHLMLQLFVCWAWPCLAVVASSVAWCQIPAFINACCETTVPESKLAEYRTQIIITSHEHREQDYRQIFIGSIKNLRT